MENNNTAFSIFVDGTRLQKTYGSYADAFAGIAAMKTADRHYRERHKYNIEPIILVD